jgi:hypothetical protein
MMRGFLVLLVILGLAAAAAYATRPNQGYHRGVASSMMEQGIVARPENAPGNYAFEDFIVLTRSTMKTGDRQLLQCWGAFTRLVCTGPAPQVAEPAIG